MEKSIDVKSIFDYYTDVVDNKNKDDLNIEVGYTGSLESQAVFVYLLGLRNFDRKPKVTNDIDYAKLDGGSLFHGFEKSDYGKNFLSEDDYNPGTGISCSGFFLTKNYYEALRYTVNFENEYVPFTSLRDYQNPNNILRVKIYKGNGTTNTYISKLAKLLSKGKVQLDENKEKMNELMSFIFDIEDKRLRKKFLKVFTNNPSNIAVYLGYDYMLDDLYSLNDNFVLFNRGILRVSQKEYDKFVPQPKGFIHY